MNLSRRGFFKATGAALATTMAFELSSQTQAFASESKQDWKLVNTEEYTSICCYCAGGCWDTSENGAYVWVNKPGTPEFTTPMLTNPKKDMTLQDPMCVYQQFKKHYSRYTLDTVCGICGMDKDVLELVYKTYTSTAKPDYEMCDLLWTAICDLYKKEGGANPDPILKTKWDYYVDGKIDPCPVAWPSTATASPAPTATSIPPTRRPTCSRATPILAPTVPPLARCGSTPACGTTTMLRSTRQSSRCVAATPRTSPVSA